MNNNMPNRLKVFADVVSIDAWHDKFTSNKTVVDLHADVVFSTGPSVEKRVLRSISG